jgi:uncharacterized protein Usg
MKPADQDLYRLTTAEILYHLPDHPGVLQSYIWQAVDRAPDFPTWRKFLDFWQREIEGKLHSVRVGAAALGAAPAQWRQVQASQALH